MYNHQQQQQQQQRWRLMETAEKEVAGRSGDCLQQSNAKTTKARTMKMEGYFQQQQSTSRAPRATFLSFLPPSPPYASLCSDFACSKQRRTVTAAAAEAAAAASCLNLKPDIFCFFFVRLSPFHAPPCLPFPFPSRQTKTNKPSSESSLSNSSSTCRRHRRRCAMTIAKCRKFFFFFFFLFFKK